MSESKSNGPLGERVTPLAVDGGGRTEIQAECDRLRAQVRELTAERDSLRESVALLKSDYKESLRSLFDYLKKEFGEEKPWPEDERECLDFRQMVEEVEKEFMDAKHAGKR
jgi:hypothetical protein